MLLKYLLPWGQFHFSTPLTLEEVAARLTAITGPAYELFGPDDVSGVEWIFVGEIGERTFRIMTPGEAYNLFNLSRTRNQFRPVFSGKLAGDGGATLITVSMRMQIMSYCFFGGMLGFGLIIACMGPIAISDFIFPAAVAGMALGTFWWMVKRTKLVLMETLSGPS